MAQYTFDDAVIIQQATDPRIILSGASITVTDGDADPNIDGPTDTSETMTLNSFTNDVNVGAEDTPGAFGQPYDTTQFTGTGQLTDDDGNLINGVFFLAQNTSVATTDDFAVFIPTEPNAGFTNAAAGGGLLANAVIEPVPYGDIAADSNDSFVVADTADTTAQDWDTGAGNDTLVAGAGADSLVGGIGDDSISGNAGDDTILGGDGADDITDSAGSNSIDGGAGNDTIVATGAGNDTISGGDDDDLVFVDNLAGASASIDGGAGDDILQSTAGDDELSGGTGSDVLNAGGGDDALDGGTDDDILQGGEGDDSLTGGDGNDLFVYEAGDGSDTIVNFLEGSTGPVSDGDALNNDRLELSGFYNDVWDLQADFEDDGILNQSNSTANGGTVDYTGFESFAGGGIAFQDGTGAPDPGISSAVLTAEVTGVACLTAGTGIETPDGTVAIERLRVGDMVITRDHGAQPVRWIGVSRLDEDQLASSPKLRPIRIRKGHFGATTDILVSPQHGILTEDGVLVRAIHLLKAGAAGVRRAKGRKQVTYVHVMFDRHEIIFADNMATESLYPGPMALAGLDSHQRDELAAIFPDFAEIETREDAARAYGPTARPFHNPAKGSRQQAV